MMNLSWPSKAHRDSFLDGTLDVIGRNIDFNYVTAVSGCSICSLDPVSNTSTNAFCPVCSGSYWIDILAVATYPAHVTWRYSEDLSWYSAGQQVKGDCLVRINYTPTAMTVVSSSKSVMVDGKTMQIDKINLRGSPEINRILITLMEKEK